MFQMTTSQIEKLGKRLTQEPLLDVDLNLLDQYRMSFSDAYKCVVTRLQNADFGFFMGRPEKSTQSIVSKLHRERTRLNKMQDIAGCRLVVSCLSEQNDVKLRLMELFSDTSVKVVDRLLKPNHGYRAVHLIISFETKLVELQLRTSAQHFWADVCEQFSDSYGYEHKYGGGEPLRRKFLDNLSENICKFETEEAFDFASYPARLREIVGNSGASLRGESDVVPN